MKVLLISANAERSIMPVPPVGLLCVAQAARDAGSWTTPSTCPPPAPRPCATESRRPGESRDSVEESVAFVDRLDLDLVKVTVGVRIYPNTPLAELAVRKGVISPEDSLLRPRFYLEHGLEGWLEEQVDAWVAARESWQR